MSTPKKPWSHPIVAAVVAVACSAGAWLAYTGQEGTCMTPSTMAELGDECHLNSFRRVCDRGQFFAEDDANGIMRCKMGGYLPPEKDYSDELDNGSLVIFRKPTP